MCPCLPPPVLWEGSDQVGFVSKKEKGTKQAVAHRPSADVQVQWAFGKGLHVSWAKEGEVCPFNALSIPASTSA